MIIETPDKFEGNTPQEVATKVHSYLWRMVEQLNLAAEQVDKTILYQAQQTSEKLSAETTQSILDGAATLKSLIIKNADIIREEMETMRIDFEGTYLAISEFGTYAERTEAAIEANSQGITQNFNYVSTIDTNLTTFTAQTEGNLDRLDNNLNTFATQTEGNLDRLDTNLNNYSAQTAENSGQLTELAGSLNELSGSVDSNLASLNSSLGALQNNTNNQITATNANLTNLTNLFNSFKTETSAYIKSGIVDYNGAIPIYGIAIGQNLVTTINNGETVIQKQKFRSIFTATKLGFWQDNTEVAYIADGKLYIPTAQILGTLVHGAFQITSDTTTGYTIKWIGA